MTADLSPCGLCGHVSFAPVWSRGYPDAEVPTVICKICGLVQTNPRPTKEELIEFYREMYRPQYSGACVPSPGQRAQTRNQYLSRYEDITPYLKPGDAVLDIGCATGEFLRILKQHHLIPTGVEASANCCAEAAKFCEDVHAGLIEDQDFEEGRFDAVCLFHVLEHLESPVAQVCRIARWLRNDGVLYVEVPDLHQPYLGNLSRFFQTAHLYSFTAATLEAVLRKTGFKRVWFRRGVEGKFLRFIARKDSAVNRETPLPVDDWESIVWKIRAWRRKWWLWHKWAGMARYYSGAVKRRLCGNE